ncbi:hypothetical protein WB91_23015 [bacteria symbiont BFo1 of Frankliniella occidentalis]|nr:hypothetical protein WB91_23015 [bacteria symbiont BFo1 of Frankliniella occidentalis]
MLASARSINVATAAELANTKAEVVRLNIALKVSALQSDLTNSKLAAVNVLQTNNQKEIERLTQAEVFSRNQLAGLQQKMAAEQRLKPDIVNSNSDTTRENSSPSIHPETTQIGPESVSRGSRDVKEISVPLPDAGLKNGQQPSGDYAAGAAMGYDASAALEMNRMLGIDANINDLVSGFSDALTHKVRYTEPQMSDAHANLSKKILAARDHIIKLQSDAGRKAMELFRLQPGATKDPQGFWYKIEKSEGTTSDLKSKVNVSIKIRSANGDLIREIVAKNKRIVDFPPLFRNVLAKIGKSGSASFLVPPALAYGDEGLSPNIPPGATLLYQITTGMGYKIIDDHSTLMKSQQYFDKFIHQGEVKKAPSGFWYQIIKQGSGKSLNNRDKVTSVMRESVAGGAVINDMVSDRQAISLPLIHYPPIFRDAIRLLKNGGAIRVVVPSGLVYTDKDRPAAVPSGAIMIYDIRVINIG